MPVEGVDDFAAALGALGARMHAASETGADAAADLVKERIQANLDLSHYPPASEPGTPPAYRSGFLRDEVYTSSVGTETGAQSEIWPSTVYARIQELGGWAGRGHKSHLDPRPYVEPALDDTAAEIGQAMIQAWTRAQGGG
jgi:phage gpG-like protein